MLEKIYSIKILGSILESLFGTLEARYLHDINLNTSGSIEKGLKNVLDRWKDRIIVENNFSPIFVFSAGWRSGSTLVQRLIMSSGKYFIWGEPYGGAGIVENMAEHFLAFSEIWPVETNFLTNFLVQNNGLANIHNKWTANVTPNIEDLILSHRKFFETLFYKPIKEFFEGWGLKEVRLSFEYALYLNFLYPRSKFIFLVRNPIEAYRSYKRFRRWYVRIPKKPVFTPYAFGKHWDRLAKSFLEGKGKVSSILLRYEDLVSRSDRVLNNLENFLSLDINYDLLRKKVGSSKPETINLTLLETVILKFVCKRTASLLGYNL